MAGVRSGIAAADLSSVLPEEVEEEVREAAEISMGTEVWDSGVGKGERKVTYSVYIMQCFLCCQISEEDILNIVHLSEQVSEKI